MTPLAALSIDLDRLDLYATIHALPGGLERRGADPIYGRAVERFGALCGRLGVRGTVFCVGRDLADPTAAAAAATLARNGHELANHSLSHDYGLARRAPAEIEAEVRGGAAAVARVSGRRPVGFRAPGYALSPALLTALDVDGYRYDSSAFPALPYYAGKAAVLAGLAAARRRSQAILDRPRVLLAPRRPYRPRTDEPYARGDAALVELPITTGLAGFPLLGTFVGTLPAWLVRALAAGTGRLPLLNLELHGLDLLDASDVPPELAARRPDVRVAAAVKLARIEQFVRERMDRRWVTLEEAADAVAAV